MTCELKMLEMCWVIRTASHGSITLLSIDSLDVAVAVAKQLSAYQEAWHLLLAVRATGGQNLLHTCCSSNQSCTGLLSIATTTCQL